MEPADIRDFGSKAFDWLVQNAGTFWSSSKWPAPRGIKQIAEVALAAGVWADTSAEGRALFNRAWDELEEGRRIASLLPTQPLVSVSYMPFVMAGVRSAELDARLAEPQWRNAYDQWHLFAQLAVGATLETIGITPPWSQQAKVVALRLFDPPAAGPTSRPIQAEYLAHAVMWRTKMGRRPAALGPATTTRFRAAARAWTAVLVRHELLDPVAEIAAACCCVGDPPPEAAMRLLRAAQRSDGGLPMHPSRGDGGFDDVYHPTIVAAILGKLAGGGEVYRHAAGDAADGEFGEYMPEPPELAEMFAD
jgi:hypothetical protein